LNKLRAQGYELLLDEVLTNAIQPHVTGKDTLTTLKKAGLIEVDDANKKSVG
jgi:hypothetical protein